MDNNAIANVKAPEMPDQTVNQGYLQNQLDTKLDKNTDIDMANHGIRNLESPLSYNNDAAVNAEFFNTQVNASNTNLYTELTKDYKAYVDKSHLTPTQKRNAFRYLMEDADESSSENNIRVLGISDFPDSPHQVNKKAYNIQFVLGEGGVENQYRSRIGFSLHPLPVGYYTMVM